MLYFVEPDKMDLINRGEPVPEIASHEKVARHYGVTSIDLAAEVTARINAGQFEWKQFGGLHPAPFGHRVYANTIERLLDAAWKEPLAAGAATRPHPMPAEPLDPLNYGRARYVGLEQAEVAGGWQLVPSWSAKDAGTRRGFVNVSMLVAEEPGAVLKLDFTGTAVGLLVVAGPDVGLLEFQVDGGPFREVDQLTQWSGHLHIPWAYMLDADLEPGQHELILRTSDKKNPKSRGHAARIVKFLVN